MNQQKNGPQKKMTLIKESQIQSGVFFLFFNLNKKNAYKIPILDPDRSIG